MTKIELAENNIKALSKYQGHQFLAKNPAKSELVVSIMNNKYGKALPLYQIEEIMAWLKEKNLAVM